jgi:hypothetical protein
LAELGKELVAALGEANVLVVPTDVSKLEQVQALSKKVYDAWGEVRICATSEDYRRAAWCLFRFSHIPSPCDFYRMFLPSYTFPEILSLSLPSRHP